MGNNIALEKEKAIEEIINRISSGESLRSILPYQNRSEHLPHIGTFLRWVSEDEKLSEHYARAMEIRADIMFEEMLEIADDGSNDFMTITKGDKEYEVENKEWVNRSKLRVDARKWILARMTPKKYSERLITENKSEIIVSEKVVAKLPDGTEIEL